MTEAKADTDPLWYEDGYIELKLTIKNPKTHMSERHQIGTHIRIGDRVNLESSLMEDPLLNEILPMLMKRILMSPPPSKQG